MRRLWVMVLFLVGVSLSPSKATAQEELSVAVLGVQAEDSARGDLTFVRSLVEDASMSLGALTPATASLRRRRDTVLPEAERVEALRAVAREAVVDFRFPDAVIALDQARSLLLARHADLLGDRALVTIHFDLARLHLDLGQSERARTILDAAVALEPDRRPEASEYPPGLILAWDEARRATGADALMDAEGERLLLVGRITGLSHVLSGTLRREGDGTLVFHLVVIRCRSGEILRPRPLRLGERSTWAEAFVSALTPVFEPPELYFVPGQAPTELFILSTPPGASITLDGRLTGFRTPRSLDAEPGPHVVLLRLDGYAETEVEAVAWEYQTRPVDVTLESTARPPFWRTWWFWTLAGVAVAGAATGLGIWGASERDQVPDATVDIVSGP